MHPFVAESEIAHLRRVQAERSIRLQRSRLAGRTDGTRWTRASRAARAAARAADGGRP